MRLTRDYRQAGHPIIPLLLQGGRLARLRGADQRCRRAADIDSMALRFYIKKNIRLNVIRSACERIQ